MWCCLVRLHSFAPCTMGRRHQGARDASSLMATPAIGFSFFQCVGSMLMFAIPVRHSPRRSHSALSMAYSPGLWPAACTLGCQHHQRVPREPRSVMDDPFFRGGSDPARPVSRPRVGSRTSAACWHNLYAMVLRCAVALAHRGGNRASRHEHNGLPHFIYLCRRFLLDFLLKPSYSRI